MHVLHTVTIESSDETDPVAQQSSYDGGIVDEDAVVKTVQLTVESVSPPQEELYHKDGELYTNSNRYYGNNNGSNNYDSGIPHKQLRLHLLQLPLISLGTRNLHVISQHEGMTGEYWHYWILQFHP